MADVAASVLAKLKNKAKAAGINYQQCLQLFMQEEFLRKLSRSGYEDTLILKGDCLSIRLPILKAEQRLMWISCFAAFPIHWMR